MAKLAWLGLRVHQFGVDLNMHLHPQVNGRTLMLKKKKKVELNVHIMQDFNPNSILYIGLEFEFKYNEYRNRG